MIQPLGRIEERVVVEMVSGVLPHPFKCRFLCFDVFQFRRELNDNPAAIQLLCTMSWTGQKSFRENNSTYGLPNTVNKAKICRERSRRSFQQLGECRLVKILDVLQ